MKRFFTILRNTFAVAVVVLWAAACDQSAIFNSIANETQKKTALINGSPTRIVKNGSALFTANGALWKRTTGGGTWSTVSTTFNFAAGGSASNLKIRDLAAAGTTLYALTVTDVDNLLENTTTSAVWSSLDGAAWNEITLDTSVSTYTGLDSLYVANNILFVGAHKTDASKIYETAYAILKLNGTQLYSVVENLGDGGMFVGASWDGTNYYAATTNLGIYRSADANTWTVMSSTTGYQLTGIFSLTTRATNQATIAVSREENTLIKLNASDAAFTATDQNYIFDSGSITEYDVGNDGIPDYLLLGIKSGTTYGYREIALSGGDLTSASPSLSKPGNVSTVLDDDQYAGALGVVPVAHMYQSWEGSANILYASSVLQGLWGSVDRAGWNLVSE